VLLSAFPLALEVEESVGLRALFALRGERVPPEQVLVVGISRDSAEVFGLSRDLDEWPRALHADLIDRLASLGAAVIVLDIMFEEPSDSRNDERLGAAIERAGNVLLLERVESRDMRLSGLEGISIMEQRVPPIEPIGAGALGIAPFTLPVVPFRTSQFWAFGRGDTTTPNLPALALQAYGLGSYTRLLELLRPSLPAEVADRLPQTVAALRAAGLQSTTRKLREIFSAYPSLAGEALARIPRDAGGSDATDTGIRALVEMYGGPSSHYLNYYGVGGTVTTIPFHEALRGSVDAPWARNLVGKVVFVGYSERRQSEQRDMFLSVYSQRTGLSLSGVEIGATAFANLLTMTSLRPLPMPAHLVWVFAFGAVVALVLVRMSTASAIALAVGVVIAYAAVAWYRFEAANAWWPLAIPLLVQVPVALAATAFLNGSYLSRQRRRIETALGYYVPKSVLLRLLRDSTDTTTDRQLVHGTCLVSDAERFTSLSERISPEALGTLVDDYYRTLAAVAQRHGGFVADVSGDSTVAIWPALESRQESHLSACRAALDMVEAIERFNRDHAPHSLPTGFGLDSGEVLLGNIGLAQHYQYRAVGDIVNTASRVQGLNRILGTRVLASQDTVAGLDELATRELGRFLLVGKLTPIVIYEVTRGGPAVDAAVFGRGLREFRLRNWDLARSLFESLAGDAPSRFFVEQCSVYSQKDLAEDWDGTIDIGVK
jgi:adenylate cyclase